PGYWDRFLFSAEIFEQVCCFLRCHRGEQSFRHRRYARFAGSLYLGTLHNPLDQRFIPKGQLSGISLEDKTAQLSIVIQRKGGEPILRRDRLRWIENLIE